MGRRSRREERETVGRGGTAARFQMRQKLLSVGDDCWIENDAGERAFRVDGRALRLRDTLDLEDGHGHVLCRIRARILRVRDSMTIEDPHGDRLASVHKTLVSPLRERWKVEPPEATDWTVRGSIAEVSKKWFRACDTDRVQVAPDQPAVLVLAMTVAVDTMSHPGK